ncbi:DUF6065 family protein [uncultured Gimesia sp.]|uniref:DUF6065 family protein n=1 Tax=uncultured Gimesia sp. TaxID=1678688 RepID=UPI0030D8D239|tara:strand:+ start:10506 stop:11258 length:753 start_codon:yes stop_codon:yes gene_type:complete
MVFNKDEHEFPDSREVSFICDQGLAEVLPAPQRSIEFIPEWFSRLALNVENYPGMKSVKGCMPFFDALTTGWIIPMWTDLTITCGSSAEGSITYEWSDHFDRPVLEEHHQEQLGQMHPKFSTPPLKLLSPWTIVSPTGYSLLITAPFNRPEIPIEILTGIVDSDRYFHPINFPFFIRGEGSQCILKRGTPVAQVIPFDRNSVIKVSTVREASIDQLEILRRHQAEMASNPSMYRKTRWINKNSHLQSGDL